MRVFQVGWSTEGRVRMFEDVDGLREWLRTFARVAAGRAAAFCAVDDHFHGLLVDPDDRPSRLAQACAQSLAARTPELQPGFIKAVESRSHLQNLVRYFVRQNVHHGIEGHPARWEGSSFHDLVGARSLDGFDAGLLPRLLPRWRVDDVAREVGLAPESLEPASLEEIRQTPLTVLRDAAAAAWCAPRALAGNLPAEVHARRALAALLAEAWPGGATDLAADLLGVCVRSARRLVAASTPELTTPVRRRLAIDLAVAGARRPAIRADPSPASLGARAPVS